MFRRAFIGVAVLLAQVASGQTEINLLTGFVLPHRPEMARLVTGHATGITLSRWKEPQGEWATTHGRWGIRQGAMLAVLDAGSPALGTQVTALWLTRLPFAAHGHLELGLGPAWSSRSYATHGAASFALAGPWNLALQLGADRRIRLPAPFHLTAGAALTHLSNGGLHLPNLGTNALTARVGLHWGGVPSSHPQVVEPEAASVRAHLLQAGVRFGARDAGLPGGPLHPITTVRLLWEARAHLLEPGATRRRAAWSPVVAAQLTLNQARRPESPSNPSARWQPAVLAGVRWWAGRVALQLAHGQLLANSSPDFGSAHLDAALVWRVHPQWQLELGLRAFSLRAEHPCIGLAWTAPSGAIRSEER